MPCAEGLCRHACHRLGMDTVVPDKPPQHLAQGPFLLVTAKEHLIFEVVQLPLQQQEAPLAAGEDIPLIICRNADLPKVIGIYILVCSYISRAVRGTAP